MSNMSNLTAVPFIAPPSENGPQAMLAVSVALLSFATISVLLRVWTRLTILKSWGWDDWFILATLGTYAAECVVLVRIAALEKHAMTLEAGEAIALLVPAEQALYVGGTVLLKLSIAVFYLRFLRAPWQRQLIIISCAIYTVFGTCIVFLVVFDCGVPSKLQMQKYFSKKCIDFSIFTSVSIAHGVANALADWVFALLPISVLWQSMLTRPAKISACLVVALAILGSVASCVRTAYIPGLAPTKNFYATSTDAMIWTVVEPGLGITAACLACLRPLFRQWIEGAKEVVESAAIKVGNRRGSRGRRPATCGPLDCQGVWVRKSINNVSARAGSSSGGGRDSSDFAKFGYFESDLERGRVRRTGVVTTIVGDAGDEQIESLETKDGSRDSSRNAHGLQWQ